MRMQGDIEIQVPVGSAVEPLSAFAPQAQPLSVRGTFGNARLERSRHAMQPAVLIVFRHGEIQVYRGTAGGIVQSDVYRDLVILTWHLKCAALPPRVLSPARMRGEQFGQIDVIERERRIPELLPPVRTRLKILAGLVAAQLGGGGALFPVLEGLVGIRHFPEFLLAGGI